MSYLLDSHTMLWAIYAPEMLSPRVRTVLEDPSFSIIISHISIWEIAAKAERNRISITRSTAREMLEDVMKLGVALAPITLDDILASALLPHHHADPFDRLLIAQAQRLQAQIISKDRKFSLYDVPVMWD